MLCVFEFENRRHHDQQHAGTAIGYVMLFWQARAQICSSTSYKYMNVGSRLHIYEGPILWKLVVLSPHYVLLPGFLFNFIVTRYS